ncbi:hypothetical protein AAHA92_14686 [Salvia divinorum]|uniref:Transmembrane protein n=1 Tax=Salvia divinorum TaxID=28513 RepID=A0ABD1HCC3_SALDI
MYLGLALLLLMCGGAVAAFGDVTIDACVTENCIAHRSSFSCWRDAELMQTVLFGGALSDPLLFGLWRPCEGMFNVGSISAVVGAVGSLSAECFCWLSYFVIFGAAVTHMIGSLKLMPLVVEALSLWHTRQILHLAHVNRPCRETRAHPNLLTQNLNLSSPVLIISNHRHKK